MTATATPTTPVDPSEFVGMVVRIRATGRKGVVRDAANGELRVFLDFGWRGRRGGGGRGRFYEHEDWFLPREVEVIGALPAEATP